MADVITSRLGLTLPDFDGPADERVLNANFQILDDAVTTATLPGAIGDLLAAGSPGQNLLTNPGFELWQRGNGPFVGVGVGVYTADRWYLGVFTGATLTVQRVAQDQGFSSLYALGFTYAHAGAGSGASVNQRIEGFEQLRGTTVSFSCVVDVDQPGAVRLGIFDGTTSQFSAYNAAAGRSVLNVTAVVPSTATALAVSIIADVKTCAGRLDNAALAIGSVRPVYAPLHPAEEWDRALRYYQEIGGLDPSGEFVGTGFVTATTTAQVIVRYVTEMAGVPTVTVVAPTSFVVGNAAGATVAVTALAVSTPPLTTRRECRLIATVAGGLVAGNATYLVGIGATPRIVLESNPS